MHMKRYSTTVIMHIVAIAAFAVGCFQAFLLGMPFTGVLLLIFLIGFGFSLYRLQMIQVRLMQQLARNIRCSDTSINFVSGYRNSQMEEMVQELREAMRIYRMRTMEANEMESWQKLIRVMGHEIMNSITPIISLSETLGSRAVDERSYAYMQQGVQIIHKRSKGLLEFVENYRRLTRIPLPKKEKVELGTLLSDLKNLFPDNFIHILPPSTEIYLQADRVQIEQVLINLVRNAREACNAVEWDERNCNPGGGDSAVCPNAAAVDGAGSGAGSGVDAGAGSGAGSGGDSGADSGVGSGAGCIGPRIEVSVFHYPEWRVALSVADNGEGILPDVLDKIFVPFFTTKEGGSGIGLSLCRQIMHLHGGSITATSTPGNGTCFTLLFP